MPIPTPFHPRTFSLCQAHDPQGEVQRVEWRNWAGYLAASAYGPGHEYEYYAIRNAAALIDVSPLFKYEIEGPQALALVNRIMTRNVVRCAVGQVMYSPWCDEAGYVIDDGAVARLAEDRFRITAADPSLRWFEDCGFGMDATVTDVSRNLAALALQGPNARRILRAAVAEDDDGAAGQAVQSLGYFRLTQAAIAGVPVTITRTGYTGDLGYELWVAAEHALRLWDALLAHGQGYGLAPAGMLALDIARIEAGLLLIDVDYVSAHKALIEAQKSSPFELGLGWTVALNKGNFVGRRALLAQRARGVPHRLVGLHIHWDSLERLFGAVGLTPQVSSRALRLSVPIHQYGRQVGQATSSAFSPLLKRQIALGVIESQYASLGSQVTVEITVEHARRQAAATVVKLPFLDLRRKRAQAGEDAEGRERP